MRVYVHVCICTCVYMYMCEKCEMNGNSTMMIFYDTILFMHPHAHTPFSPHALTPPHPPPHTRIVEGYIFTSTRLATGDTPSTLHTPKNVWEAGAQWSSWYGFAQSPLSRSTWAVTRRCSRVLITHPGAMMGSVGSTTSMSMSPGRRWE